MSDEHDWLGDLPGVKDIQDAAGITYPRRARLRFEGATVADDPVNGRTVVSVPGSGSQPSHTLANILSAGNSANGSKITNLGSPDSDSDAATKKYVDDALSGYSPPVPSFSDVLTEGNATGGTPIESDDHEEAPLRVANTSIEYEEEIGPRQLSVSPVPAKVRVHRRAASGVLEDDMMKALCLEVGLHADDWPEPGLIVAEAEVAIWNDDFSNAYACKVFGSYSVSAEGAITLQHTSFLGDELPDGLSDPAFSTS